MARRSAFIPTSSMADIAFLLLIFFLTTTSLDIDVGLMRLLPPPLDPTVKPPEIKKRNVLQILVNYKNEIMVEGEILDVKQLKDKLKEFITNPTDREDLPEKIIITEELCAKKIAEKEALLKSDEKNAQQHKIDLELWKKRLEARKIIGKDYVITNHVISLRNDRGTKYETYIAVQDAISWAYAEIRDEKAKEYFNKPFILLSEAEKEAIRTLIPMKLSEAEPKQVGVRK